MITGLIILAIYLIGVLAALKAEIYYKGKGFRYNKKVEISGYTVIGCLCSWFTFLTVLIDLLTEANFEFKNPFYKDKEK